MERLRHLDEDQVSFLASFIKFQSDAMLLRFALDQLLPIVSDLTPQVLAAIEKVLRVCDGQSWSSDAIAAVYRQVKDLAADPGLARSVLGILACGFNPATSFDRVKLYELRSFVPIDVYVSALRGRQDAWPFLFQTFPVSSGRDLTILAKLAQAFRCPEANFLAVLSPTGIKKGSKIQSIPFVEFLLEFFRRPVIDLGIVGAIIAGADQHL
jgi:hypothetical protein